MSGNTFGKLYRFTSFGESHNDMMGVVVDGVPSNIQLDLNFIQNELNRRKPSNNPFSSTRKEPDKYSIKSGLFDGKTTGAPLTFIIKNKDHNSNDYIELENIYRPGHADFTFHKKYGNYDYIGGGRASGRETISRVIAGAVAKQILKKWNIVINAYTIQVGKYHANIRNYEYGMDNFLRFPDADVYPQVIKYLQDIQECKDSAGGVVEIIAKNVPVGLGCPVFDKIDADIAKAMMSIGSVKGVEIGLGFLSTQLMGSENNDEMDNNGFQSNNSGGILGGISNGEDIITKIAVKPTPSIGVSQKTITHEGIETEIKIKGRHDTIIVPRILPVAESMIAVVILDHLLIKNAYNDFE